MAFLIAPRKNPITRVALSGFSIRSMDLATRLRGGYAHLTPARAALSTQEPEVAFENSVNQAAAGKARAKAANPKRDIKAGQHLMLAHFAQTRYWDWFTEICLKLSMMLMCLGKQNIYLFKNNGLHIFFRVKDLQSHKQSRLTGAAKC